MDSAIQKALSVMAHNNPMTCMKCIVDGITTVRGIGDHITTTDPKSALHKMARAGLITMEFDRDSKKYILGLPDREDAPEYIKALIDHVWHPQYYIFVSALKSPARAHDFNYVWRSRPDFDTLYATRGREGVDRLVKSGLIEILPNVKYQVLIKSDLVDPFMTALDL